MKKLFSSLLVLVTLALCGLAHSADVTFVTTTAEINNPGRGFSNWGGSQYLNNFDSGSLSSTRNSSGDSIAIGEVDLSAYRTTATIDDAYIANLNAKFALVRAAGMKVMIRPVYNYDGAGQDATTAIVLAHVARLGPVFYANADVILTWQVGFFGPFGEWWDGANTITRTAAERQQLLNAVHAVAHPYTLLEVRYPKWVTAMPDASSAMTIAKAFNGSSQAQIGYHNDCISAGGNDSGTYLSSNTTISGNPERARVSQDTLFSLYGGEGCTGVGTPTRQSCAEVMGEFPLYHFTYINRIYPAAWITQWQNEGCFAQLRRSLGYRVQLDRLAHPDTIAVNQPITFAVYARNTGWATVMEPYVPQIRLVGTNVYAAKGYSDMRLEMNPQATTSTKLPVKISVPVAGTYSVQICLPSPWTDSTGKLDATTKIAADIRYNIREANADSGAQAWNTTSGCFASGTSITVTP